MKGDRAILVVFIILLVFAFGISLIGNRPSPLRSGRPMIVPDSEIDGIDLYVLRVEFGRDYSFVAVFDSAESLKAFAAIAR